MGTQTMGSNGGAQKSMLNSLSRQGSLYNLTLDEVQQQLGDLGKPFSSMNLDELLKNVYTAGTNQGMSGNAPNYTELAQLDSGVTRKTVDEVWQDIQQGQKMKEKNVSDDDDDDNDGDDDDKNRKDGSFKNGDRKRQTTLGEMTLEDFLVKAGIVAESSPGKINQEQNLEQQESEQWLNYQTPTIQQQNVIMAGRYQVQQPLTVPSNPLMDGGYMSPAPLIGGFSDRHMSGRKRFACGDVMEKTVERRQKRMIKNRESAARSRARKQAYTHELENKVSRLEEENERLRREKELDKVIPWVPPPKPKYQLRRTSSALF